VASASGVTLLRSSKPGLAIGTGLPKAPFLRGSAPARRRLSPVNNVVWRGVRNLRVCRRAEGEGMSCVQAKRLLVGLFGAVLLAACSSGTAIQGHVVDISGSPVVGQLVIISSGPFSQRTVSDAQGAFSVANAPSPYDATLIFPGEVTAALVYAGLTRLDPTLSTDSGLQHSATLTGQINGGQYPEPPGYVTVFGFGSQQLATPYVQEPVSGSYASTFSFFGPTSLSGTLYALQAHLDAVSGFPLDYPGYGTLTGITLEDGATLANQDISLGPVSTGMLTGTFSTPPNYQLESATLSLLAAPGAVLSGVVSDNLPDASFSYVTPAISGTSLIVGAMAQGGTGSSYAQLLFSASASDVMLTIPPAPTLLQPAGGSADVTVATPFSWTWPQISGALYMVVIVGPGQGFNIYTTATTLIIPDLADAGLALVPSASYLWQVYGFAPVASVDQLAGPVSLTLRYASDFEGVSNQQYFNTSP
jgi:hypothetical protein